MPRRCPCFSFVLDEEDEGKNIKEIEVALSCACHCFRPFFNISIWEKTAEAKEDARLLSNRFVFVLFSYLHKFSSCHNSLALGTINSLAINNTLFLLPLFALAIYKRGMKAPICSHKRLSSKAARIVGLVIVMVATTLSMIRAF